MTRYMIDIETAATTPNAAILSIGAVEFLDKEPYVIREFKVNVNLDSCKKEGMIVSAETIKWWDQQDMRAQLALLRPSPVQLRVALQRFAGWLGDGAKKAEFWARSPSFDMVILQNAFNATGTPVPWDFHLFRDVRSYEEAALSLGITKHMWECSDEGVKHDSLNDAKKQANEVGRILQLLRSVKVNDQRSEKVQSGEGTTELHSPEGTSEHPGSGRVGEGSDQV